MKMRNLFPRSIICILFLSFLLGTMRLVQASPSLQAGGDDPPSRVVKLIFIHHSTGENWLADDYGNLGRLLSENNYYVSDTNYGWGPNGIGDRTDIPDWLEWFSSGDTEIYMQALFNEDQQHAGYTRSMADPGGENEIILFKSCFPNSNLDGNPSDPPSPDGWLTVGNAKYVYNQILEYFGQHPEKLFVVITAPPLSDRSNAANARAFNLWLLNDWLQENEYPYNNVAVFDFYNVLTGKNGQHTYEDGREIHQVAKKDTLEYPSGDDHPSKKGSQKATEDFIPLLNYFYHRWQADNPSPLPPTDEGQAENNSENLTPGRTTALSTLIDDFDGEAPASTNSWEVYRDDGAQTSLDCQKVPGTGESGSSLQLTYLIAPHGWGTCGLFYDNPQDWSAAAGLAFMIRTDQAAGPLHVDLYSTGPDGQESYIYELPLSPDMQEDWIQVGIPWDAFLRVDWEEGAGTPFDHQDRISGLAFGFGAEESEISGSLWVDDLGWIGLAERPAEELIDSLPESDNLPEGDQESRGVNLPCIGSLAAPIGLAGAAVYFRKKG